MKLAIIGARNLVVENLEDYIPSNCDEIVSGGARGIDKCAEDFAHRKAIRLTVFLPDYKRFGRGAPLKRNEEIAQYSDCAIAFWDGRSKGTQYSIKLFEKLGKPVKFVIIQPDASI